MNFPSPFENNQQFAVPGSMFCGYGNVPVGTIVPFAGILLSKDQIPQVEVSLDSVPSKGFGFYPEQWGWLPCDGSSYSRFWEDVTSTDDGCYPDLYAVIGYLYGMDGNKFKVPDYRGYFLRALDPSTSDQAENENREAYKGGKGGKTDPGSTQGDAFLTHEHNYYQAVIAAASPGAPPPPTPAGTSATLSQTVNGPVKAGGVSLGQQVSKYETRPKNIYVNYLIKAAYGSRLW